MAINKIDIGTAGDPQTGDNIYDGGQKINEMFEEVYEANAPEDGDYRMTGWWLPDEGALVNIANPLVPGDKIDLDTQISQKTVEVGGAQTYAVGDQIMIRDQFNTWSTNPPTIQTTGGGLINNRQSHQIRSKGAIVTLTCIDSTNNNWDMRVDSKRGRFDNAIDVRGTITPSSSLSAVVYNNNNIVAAKLLIAGTLDSDPDVRTVSEILVTDDGAQVLSTEYAVLNTSTDPIIDISFDFTADEVSILVETTDPSVTIRIKTVEFTDI